MTLWPKRDKLLLKALVQAARETAFLRLQVAALRDPDSFKWAFIRVNDLVNRLSNGPKLPEGEESPPKGTY